MTVYNLLLSLSPNELCELIHKKLCPADLCPLRNTCCAVDDAQCIEMLNEFLNKDIRDIVLENI